MRSRPTYLIVVTSLAFATVVAGQQRGVFVEPRDHEAILYSSAPVANPVTRLIQGIEDGSVTLQFEEGTGYLRSVLQALDVPVQSQMLVFSKTSLQSRLIDMHNPRAVYFNDSVAIGWVRGANCLACHLSWETLGAPGMLVMSTFPLKDDKLDFANGFTNDHRSPFPERWGGWYVTGDAGRAPHMGNVGVFVADRARSKLAMPRAPRPSLEGLFDLTHYLTPYSDVAALMVLSHQVRATNLMTRAGWEARVAEGRGPDGAARVREAATELAEYLLFADEVPLAAPMRSTAGFPEAFAARGPADSRGRSLRQMDLTRRMMRYPASYMIYNEAFDALPAAAKEQVYARMWEILSGRERGSKFARLTLADRQAVVEILRETKKDLPPYFQPVTR
jgi:hypothetical protein